jgi:hypothetical protein
MAEFIAEGLREASLTRAGDKRGQACAAISRLYYLLVELRELTRHMADAAQLAVDSGNPEIIAYHFHGIHRRIARLTNDFVETFTMLQDSLEIFAPDVAQALCAVSYSKSNLLWNITQYVVLDGSEASGVRKVQFLKPDERILNLDIGAFVQRLKNGEAERRAERFEWPDRLLYYGSTENAFSNEEITFANVEDAERFAALLREHGAVLSTGITALKQYIRETFTIDEVLYERVDIEPEIFA